MPNLECHICGSTCDVKWADWFGKEVPLCRECREDFNADGSVNCDDCDDDFEYDDYVSL